MSLYLDIHEHAPEGLTLEAFEQAHQVDLDHQAKHGVTFRQYWVDLAARKVFCLVEAPGAEAAAAVHREGHGLLANRIYEVVEGHRSHRKGTAMSTAFIYTGTYKVRDGRFEDARNRLAEHTEFIEANEPRLVAFHVFTDEAAGTVSIVQVHRDPESMEFHMKLVAEHIKAALNDYLGETVSTHVYGGAGAPIVDTIRQYDPDTNVVTEHLAGFTRTTAA